MLFFFRIVELEGPTGLLVDGNEVNMISSSSF